MALKTAANTSLNSTTLVAPGKLDLTKLYLDFLKGKSPATGFYPAESVEAVVAGLDRIAYDRTTIVDILLRQNRAYNASDRALGNLERLRSERAVCIFGGQQAGLFGGPLFTIIKALALVKLARAYETRLNRPVVPIFWIAGDDHDFAEINHTHVLSRQGEVSKVAYQTAPATELPAAEIRLDDALELERAIDELSEHLGPTDFTPSLFETIRTAYTTQDTMVAAFGKLMAALTKEYGLILFNPSDEAVKRLAEPFFQTVIEQQDAIHDTLADTNARLLQCGYHLQVEKKEDAVHLFCNLGGRTPIMRSGDGFTVGNRSFSKPELLKLLHERPEAFSPDVILRPLLQAWLFPVATQIGGSSEIAYFAQLNGLFPLVGRLAPVYSARPSVTLVERRAEQLMADIGFSFEDLLGNIEQVVNRVLSRTFPADLQENSATLRRTVEERFRQFIADVLVFDPGLKETAEQTRGKIDYLLNGFEAKVFAAHKKRSQQTRERIYRVGNALYPYHGLQERTLNISFFVSRYGWGIVSYLYDHMNAEETAHQLISLGEYEP